MLENLKTRIDFLDEMYAAQLLDWYSNFEGGSGSLRQLALKSVSSTYHSEGDHLWPPEIRSVQPEYKAKASQVK